jgi:hypothetical protein
VILSKIAGYSKQIKEYEIINKDLELGLTKLEKKIEAVNKQLEYLNKLQEVYSDEADDAWGADKLKAIDKVNDGLKI